MSGTSSEAATGTYRPRSPEGTVLYQAVRQHWPRFVARAAEADRRVPDFVRDEVAAYLACGILAHGFARVVCEGCGFTRLVPFSCKGRGFCPSCLGRRMSDTAAHLVDRVIPRIPVRQWVLSIPVPLRYLLAYDAEVCALVLGIFVQAVCAHLRRVAKAELALSRLDDAHPGAVCLLQRFGSAGNLNVHLHLLATDGVYVRRDDGALEFRALRGPTSAEVAAVAWRTCEKTVAALRKRGLWLDAEPAEADRLALDEPLLSACYSASLLGTIATGPNAGKRLVRLYGTAARDHDHDSEQDAGKSPKNAYGFDVHAGVRVPGHDKKRLERLACYVARPPFANERLTKLEGGKYSLRLKRPYSDGTTHIVMDGATLMERLVALVPPPRKHLVRYFGVFSSHAKLRSLVVPARPVQEKPACADAGHAAASPGAGEPGGGPGAGEPASAADAAVAEAGRARRIAWARLLARVFAVDVLECPKCKSRMQRLAFVTRPSAIAAILASVSQSTGPPGASVAALQVGLAEKNEAMASELLEQVADDLAAP